MQACDICGHVTLAGYVAYIGCVTYRGHATYGSCVTYTGEGDTLIKVGTVGWALGFSGVNFCPGIRFSWKINSAAHQVSKSCDKKYVKFDIKVNGKWHSH